MTGSNIVLDTNIIIDYLDEQPDILTIVNHLTALFVPVIVVGELYIGIFRSVPSITQAKTEKIERFLSKTTIWPVDTITAKIYAEIKAALFKKGRPVPENDIWIAAAAIRPNLPLYTNDSHFLEIDGLDLFNPSTSI